MPFSISETVLEIMVESEMFVAVWDGYSGFHNKHPGGVKCADKLSPSSLGTSSGRLSLAGSLWQALSGRALSGRLSLAGLSLAWLTPAGLTPAGLFCVFSKNSFGFSNNLLDFGKKHFLILAKKVNVL